MTMLPVCSVEVRGPRRPINAPFQRRHIRALAATIATMGNVCDPRDPLRRMLATEFERMLRTTNPAFKARIWFKACGVEPCS